jgi:hypothetical protein
MDVAAAQWIADRDRRGASRRGPITLRVRVVFRRGILDRLLAAGADPSWDAELAARAAQLTVLRRRRVLSESIVRVVRDAERPPRWTCAAPLNRRAVRGAAPDLQALAADLRDDPAPAPQGIALAEQLLRDPCSPLYAGGDEDALRRGARIARRALAHHVNSREDMS